MAVPSTYKLALLAHKKKFPRMPEQRDDSVYGIVWDVFGKDPRETCYLVRFVQKNEVELLAYVSVAGEVFRTQQPAAKASLPSEPDMQLILDESDDKNGMLTVCGADGVLRMLCYCDGSPEGTMRERSKTKTWNSTRSMRYGEFMASMFLRYMVLGDPDALPQGTQGMAVAAGAKGTRDSLEIERLDEPVELFAGFDTTSLGDAVGALLYRIGKNENPCGIERYAVRLFGELDVNRLATVAVKCGAALADIERTNMFYVNYDPSAVEPDEVECLLAFETVMNRLRNVLEHIDVGLKPSEWSPSERGCSRIDQMGFCTVTGAVEELLKQVGSDNPWACPGTVACVPAGEWDLRTRFAHASESLNLTTRLDYTFDSNAAEGVISVRVAGTSSAQMPASRYELPDGPWVELSDEERAVYAREHDARAALVLAAAAFSAGVTVKTCYVTVDPPKTKPDRSPNSFAFERDRFMVETAAAAHGLVGEPYDGRPCFELLASDYAVENVPEVSPAVCHASPRNDPRALPSELRDMLMADSASEMEVMEVPDDPYTARLVALREQLETEPQAAVEGLVKLVEELEAACTVQELMATAPVQSLFCDSQLGRIVFPVLETDRSQRILRVPDALYFAESELCGFLVQQGDFERALPEARKLYDMARASMQAHFTLINVLSQLQRFDEIVEVARHGLRIATDRESIGYLFYRLAFAYWQCGDRELGLMCYRMVPRGEYVTTNADEEMQGLMDEMGVAEVPSFEEAVRTLKAADLEIPPVPAVQNQIADAAVLLTDNGFYNLAVRCVYQMWRIMGNDDLGALNRSLAGR